MIKLIFAIVLTVSLAGLSTPAQQKYWTSFYIRERASSSANEACRCELLQSEEKMDSYLPRVGWPIEKVKPSVHWDKEVVVVIAPAKSYSGFDLAFSDVKWTGSEFRLDWGWWNSYRQRYRQSSTSTVGGNGNPKILVVVVPRYVAESYTLKCQEIGGNTSKVIIFQSMNNQAFVHPVSIALQRIRTQPALTGVSFTEPLPMPRAWNRQETWVDICRPGVRRDNRLIWEL